MKLLRNIVGFVMMIVATASCGINKFLQDNERTARITVTYATLKVIHGDAARKDRVIEITQNVLKYANDATQLTVDALIVAIRAEIHWDNLDDADTLLVNELLVELNDRLKEHFQGNVIPPDMVISVNTIGKWVLDAANMARIQTQTE